MSKHLKYCLISTFLLICCLNLTAYAATEFEWRMILHFAGKQRMLTQKMSKEILFIAKGIDVKANKYNLYKTATIFEWTLKGLRKGDKRLRLIKIENPAIVQQLYKVAQLWDIFRQNVDAVLAGDTSASVLKPVADQNMPLLENMDQVVKMYEKESSYSLDQSKARLLNLTGKQRMLTQKMTKELLLVANGIAPEENQANLKQTQSQFERILIGLSKGDAGLGLSGTLNSALRSQLRLVKRIWEQYKLILNKSEISQEDLIKAADLNMLLLKEMNNAMKIS